MNDHRKDTAAPRTTRPTALPADQTAGPRLRQPGETDRRDEHSGLLLPKEPPRMQFEVRILDGPEGEQLAMEQARVMREVLEWVAQRRSEPGQRSAA